MHLCELIDSTARCIIDRKTNDDFLNFMAACPPKRSQACLTIAEGMTVYHISLGRGTVEVMPERENDPVGFHGRWVRHDEKFVLVRRASE